MASVFFASVTNAVIAWTLGRLMWKKSPVPMIATMDFGADSVMIGKYDCVGTTICYWQPRTAQDWYFNPGRLDANKNPRARPAEFALTRPWTTQLLPNWVPDWAGFGALQAAPRRVEEVWSCAQGWPFRSFSCSFVDCSLWGQPFRLTYTVLSGIPLDNKIDRTPGGPTFFHYSALACTPIWRGLLGNTAFYALVWLGLLYMCASTRTWWPMSGRCLSCGYSLQGLRQSVCPECGKSLHAIPHSA